MGFKEKRVTPRCAVHHHRTIRFTQTQSYCIYIYISMCTMSVDCAFLHVIYTTEMMQSDCAASSHNSGPPIEVNVVFSLAPRTVKSLLSPSEIDSLNGLEKVTRPPTAPTLYILSWSFHDAVPAYLWSLCQRRLTRSVLWYVSMKLVHQRHR